MIRTLFALSLALLTFAAACGGGNSSHTASLNTTLPAGTPTLGAQSCTTSGPQAPGDTPQTVMSGGSQRAYLLHIPTSYSGTQAMPVVLAFHGYGLSATQMADYTKFGALADKRGFIVVSPDGAGSTQHWNWRKAVNEPNDVQFITDLLTKLATDLCIDPDKIFAAGFSDGAAMSRVLACDLPDRIAAIATIASPGVSCIAPVPMVAFHGTADPLIPFEGGVVPPEVGGGGTFPPVRRAISDWARSLGCDGLATISRPAATTELSTYVRCARGDGEALLYTLLGGGHTWPGSTPLPEQFGPTNEDIDATLVAWEFFAAHPLAH